MNGERELRPFGWEFRELERAPRLEPDEEDALTALRHDALGVNVPRIDLVAEFVLQRLHDDPESVSLIVPGEVLHILQHEGGRLVVLENVPDGEEEVALLHVLEPVLAAEAVLLGDAREAEGLAGKAAAEDVELGDVGHGHGMDVAVRGLAEVGGVGLPAELVPVAGEDALGSRPLEGEPEPADAAEEVDEAQGGALAHHPSTPSERRGRRIGAGAVRRGLFAEGRRRGDESLTLIGSGRSLSLLTSAPTRIEFPPHASTPLSSSAVVKPRALASLATFLMPGFRSPRSMPEM